MRLSELRTGEKGVIVKVMGRGAFRKRIIEMGFIRGKEVDVIQNAPLKDPIHYRVMGYDVSLRRNDAQMIEVVSVAEFKPVPENRKTARWILISKHLARVYRLWPCTKVKPSMSH
jgi:ferrous iron transport protein B